MGEPHRIRFRMTLRARLLLAVAGTVLALAALSMVALGSLMGREIDRSVRGDVRAAGGVLDQLIRERSAALRNQCLLFARQPVFKAYFGQSDYAPGAAPLVRPDAATIADSLGEYLRDVGADAAVVTDRDGRTLADTGTSDAAHGAGADRSGTAGVSTALGGEVWTGVTVLRGQPALAVCVPVRIHGEVLGTFTAYRPFDASVAADLKRALGTDVAFVYQGRVVSASLAAPPAVRVTRMAAAPRVVSAGGQRYFALYSPLPGTGAHAAIGFVTLRRYDEAMALAARFRLLLLCVTLGALAVALLAGTAVARGITRPLDGVVRAAEQMREGQWPQQFAVTRADEIGLLQSVFNEMTGALKANEERLLALIDTDPLTELDNHRRFQERLAQEARRSAVSKEALSLLLVDLDCFQQYNQSLGHRAGDDAIRRLSLVVRNTAPEFAILARYGGDELAVLLPRCALDEAERMAERIRAAAHSAAPPETGRLTVSVGCAEYGTHTEQAEGLALAAELAVSRAKQLGRDRVCRFDSLPGADRNADPYQLHRFLKDGSIATIQALAAAVDAKDPYTQGHSARVAAYARDLARYLGLPGNTVELVYTTGTLHDVGKIGVPDAVLKKPGRLDDEERAVMETHPALGEVIVRKAPQLAATLPGVRHHHERWDGGGYPDGLRGEEIPLVARVLAVADTYDAMTSDRPYRKGLARGSALAEIAKGAGTQFEPEVAEAFVAMMSEAEERRVA